MPDLTQHNGPMSSLGDQIRWLAYGQKGADYETTRRLADEADALTDAANAARERIAALTETRERQRAEIRRLHTERDALQAASGRQAATIGRVQALANRWAHGDPACICNDSQRAADIRAAIWHDPATGALAVAS